MNSDSRQVSPQEYDSAADSAPSNDPEINKSVSLAELIERATMLAPSPLARKDYQWVTAEPLAQLAEFDDAHIVRFVANLGRHLPSGNRESAISPREILSQGLRSIYTRSWAAEGLLEKINHLSDRKEHLIWRDQDPPAERTNIISRSMEARKLLRAEAGIADAFWGVFKSTSKVAAPDIWRAIDSQSSSNEQRRFNALTLSDKMANKLLPQAASPFATTKLIPTPENQILALPSIEAKLIQRNIHSDARLLKNDILALIELIEDCPNLEKSSRAQIRNYILPRLDEISDKKENFKAYIGKNGDNYIFQMSSTSKKEMTPKTLESKIDTALITVGKKYDLTPPFLLEMPRYIKSVAKKTKQ